MAKEANHLHQCAHCQEDCVDESIVFDEKIFCCVGCRTVYEILSENDLCEYYEIDKPSNKISQANYGERYAFLDADEIREHLYQFKEKDFRTVSFYVPTIHCSSCIWLLENLHRLNNGISSSVVHFVKKKVKINFDESSVSLREVVELMADIGYPPDINLDNNKLDSKKSIQRNLLIKMGIAGFCFGNIMFLSFPEYLSFQFKDEAEYLRIFAWLNVLLSLPVLLYSASDYYKSAYKGIKLGIINIDVPVSLGISVLFIRSVWEIYASSGAGYLDSLTGLVFFLLIGKWFQGKTYNAMSFERDYRSYFPLAVSIIEKGLRKGLLVNHLKKGDIMYVRNGELIPADSILSSDFSKIDYSFVTGESAPVKKKKGDFIYAGGRQIGEPVELIVEKPVSQSYLTDLWNQSAFEKNKSSRYTSIIDRVSQYFTIVIISIALASSCYWFFVHSSPTLAVETLTAVLIIACPCALALSLPFALGNSIRILGKNGLYLKNSSGIENMASIDTVVFDKTGTITQNNKQDVLFVGEKRLTKAEYAMVKSLSEASPHPLSQAISQSLESKIKELKMSGFEEFIGKGISAVFGEIQVKLGSNEFLGVENLGKSSSVHLSINGTYKGYFKVKKAKRKGYEKMLASFSKNGYEIHLISGDNSQDSAEWQSHFQKENIHFNYSPQDKLNYIENLKKKGKRVLMFGDGLNDSGALKSADVGIAISEDVFAFSPACDGILDSERFNQLFNFIAFSKKSMEVVKWSFALSFLYSFVGMYFAIQGLLTPIVAAILMPLSSITIVVFVTLATNLKSKFLIQ